MSASTLPIGTTLTSPAATATGGSAAAAGAGTVNGVPPG